MRNTGRSCSPAMVQVYPERPFKIGPMHRRKAPESGLRPKASKAPLWSFTGLSGVAEVDFLVLPEVVHVEVALGVPVFVGFDG